MKKLLTLLFLLFTISARAQVGPVFLQPGTFITWSNDLVNTVTIKDTTNTMGGMVDVLPSVAGTAGYALTSHGTNPDTWYWSPAGGSVGVIALASLGTNTDNYAPPACSLLRLTVAADFELTGIVAGVDGQLLTIENVGAFHCSLINNATSTAANRFLMPGNFAIGPNALVTLEYNATQQRWKLLNTQ